MTDDPNLVVANSQEVFETMKAEVLAFLTDDDRVERMAAMGHVNLSVGFLVAAVDAIARASGGNVPECPMTATMVTHAHTTVSLIVDAMRGALEQHPDAPLPEQETTAPVH